MILFLLVSSGFAADLDLPQLSPHATVSQTVGLVTLEVDYHSPAKRDRTIWGELVPYGKPWRTGANEETTLTTDGEIKVGGKTLPAGRYGLLTVPGETSWTVVLTSQSDLWGTNGYDEKQDVLRVEVKPESGAERERMTFLFTDTTDDSTRLDLVWAGVRVGIPITVETKDQMVAEIEGFTKGTMGDLARAARYASENGNHEQAVKLSNASLALGKTWSTVWIHANVLKGAGQNKEAYKAAEEAMALGKTDSNFYNKAAVEKALAEWPKK